MTNNDKLDNRKVKFEEDLVSLIEKYQYDILEECNLTIDITINTQMDHSGLYEYLIDFKI